MKKSNRNRTIIVFVIWIVLLVTIPIISINIQELLSSENNTYISSDYEIESYDVTLDVDKDNKVDVTENIKINISFFISVRRSFPKVSLLPESP